MQNNELFNGLPCGTNTRLIYEFGTKIYGWDRSQINQFGRVGVPLYARSATSESYSVWCIAYSNLNTKKLNTKKLNTKKSGNWRNEILNNDDNINEYWEKLTYDYLHDFNDPTYRVTFAKETDGKYYFLGVYKLSDKPDATKQVLYKGKYLWVRRYKRISEIYPFKR